MISIQPFDFSLAACPTCKHEKVEVRAYFFQGVHVLIDAYCQACELEFWHSMPIAQDYYHPIALRKSNLHNLAPHSSNEWLVRPLIDGLKGRKQVPVRLEKTVYANRSSDAIILNCLDDCFGHIFSKLWNAQTLQKNHPTKHLIVLAPKSIAWMIPSNVDETWLIAIPLAQANALLKGLDAGIKAELSRFKQVWLSQVPVHLDHHTRVDLEALLGRKRFPLKNFLSTNPCVTFALREDRLWHGSVLLGYLYLASVKFRLFSAFRWLFLRRQRSLVTRTAKLLHREIPNLSIYLTGLGKSLAFSSAFQDYRVSQVSEEIEYQWMDIYAKSHIIVGVHGSNMLIPTALSAGFINILPRYKVDHIAEDTLLPYPNRMLQFMGRFLDENSGPQRVASHIISIFSKFSYVYESTGQDVE